MKDPPLINHLQPNHAMNLKENKEPIVNMNHSSYLKDGRPQDQPPFGYQGREPPREPQPNTSTVIKMEPRDEPIELTSQSRGDPMPYGSMQPLNIAQPVSLSQHLPQTSRPCEVCSCVYFNFRNCV